MKNLKDIVGSINNNSSHLSDTLSTIDLMTFPGLDGRYDIQYAHAKYHLELIKLKSNENIFNIFSDSDFDFDVWSKKQDKMIDKAIFVASCRMVVNFIIYIAIIIATFTSFIVSGGNQLYLLLLLLYIIPFVFNTLYRIKKMKQIEQVIEETKYYNESYSPLSY